ncbi:MAG: transposase [Chloroflexi bacterium]|nr:transposase [Chloroflexota bacterium]
MKAHIGVDAVTGLVHSVATTPANVADITQVPQLLHGAETRVCGNAGSAGVVPRPEHRRRAIDWQVALRRGQRRRLPPGSAAAQAEQYKACIPTKVEHPFLHLARHFSYGQVRYRGLAKNRIRLCLLFGFANLLLATRAAPA